MVTYRRLRAGGENTLTIVFVQSNVLEYGNAKVSPKLYRLEMNNFILDKTNKMLDIINWRFGNMKKRRRTIVVSGILICLTGAGLMFEGTNLSETTTNIATVLGITGIGLIATATQKRVMEKRR